MRDVHVYSRKLKSGIAWSYRFEIAAVDGQRQFATKGGFPTKAEAKKAGMKAQQDYETLGHIVNVSDMSFADFLDEWLHSCTDLKPLTVQNYEKKIRLYIKPTLGKYRLKAIENDNLQNVITSLFHQGRSLNTLSTVRGILSSALKYAVKMKYIPYSPFIDVRIPRNITPQNETVSDPHIYIEKEQMARIFERFPNGTSAFIPLMLGYRCGLRLGEAFALTWDDIDFEKKEISIRRQIQWHQIGKPGTVGRGGNKRKTWQEQMETPDEDDIGYWYFTKPKYNSFRVVDLDDDFAEILKREKERQEYNRNNPRYGSLYTMYYLSKDAAGNPFVSVKPNDTPLWFVSVREDGTYANERIMQHAGRIIRTQLGIDGFDFHSLRHTHATDLVNQGATPQYVKERMGHKNIETTMNIYFHLTHETRKKEAEKLNSMFN